MILRYRFTSRTLVVLALCLIAAGNAFRFLLVRTGRATDLTDFSLGVLFGVGVGVLLLVAWRTRRDRALR